MTNYYFRVLLTLLAACTLYFSCAASPKKGAMRKMLTSQKDNGYGKVINDSIVAIIFDAKKVTCELQSKNPSDITRNDTIAVLSTEMKTVFDYLFFDNDNFLSDDVVFGGFQSWVCFKFIVNKKKVIYLELDFGLRKWRILDKEKKQICKQDMKKNNMVFLRFTRMLFPEDKTLKMLHDNLTDSK